MTGSNYATEGDGLFVTYTTGEWELTNGQNEELIGAYVKERIN